MRTRSHTLLAMACLIVLCFEAGSTNAAPCEKTCRGALSTCFCRLSSDQLMREDEQLYSASGTYRVVFKCAGQVEIISDTGARKWTSVISIAQMWAVNGDCMLQLRSSGNLVLVSETNNIFWQTFSRTAPACETSNHQANDSIFAFVSDAGELSVVACGETIWSTSIRFSELPTRLHTPFISAGYPIYPGSFLASPADSVRLLFGRDGSLTIRSTVSDTILWDADEMSPKGRLRGKSAAIAIVQGWDGHFAVSDKYGGELWGARAYAYNLHYLRPNCGWEDIRLYLDDDGNLDVHDCEDRPSWRIARARNLNAINGCPGNATTSVLLPNRLLKPKGCLTSPGGQYRFEVSAFGVATLRNLSLSPSSGDDIVWFSRAKDSMEARGLLLEKAGNLVIIDWDDQITWSLFESAAETINCKTPNPTLVLDDSGMLALRICGRVVWFASANSGCKAQRAAKGGSLPRGFLLFPGSSLSSSRGSYRLELTCNGSLELRRAEIPGSNSESAVVWTPTPSLLSAQPGNLWLEYSYENGIALRDSSQVLWSPIPTVYVPQRNWINRKLEVNALRLSDSGTLSVQSVGVTVWRQDCDSEKPAELLQVPLGETPSVGTFLISPSRSNRIGRRCNGEHVVERNIFGCQRSAFPDHITMYDGLDGFGENGVLFNDVPNDDSCGNASQRDLLRLSDSGDVFTGACRVELKTRDVGSTEPAWLHIVGWFWSYASICYRAMSEAKQGQQALTAQDCLQMLAQCRMQECVDAATYKGPYRLCSAGICEFLQDQLRLVNKSRSEVLGRLASTGTGAFPPKQVLLDLGEFDRMWHLHLISAACSDSPSHNATVLPRTYCSLIPQAVWSIFVITYWGQNFGIVSSHTRFIQLRFYAMTLASRTHPGAHAGQTNLLYWAPFFCVGVTAAMATIKRMLSEDYSLAMTLHFAIFILYAFIFFATVCTWCVPMFLLLLSPFCEFISPEKLPQLVYDIPYRLCETMLSLSNFLQAALCAERFIALYFPMYFGKHNTQRNGRRAVLLALAYGVLNGFFQFYSALYYGQFISFNSGSLRDTIVAGVTVALQSVVALSVELILGFLIAAKLFVRYRQHKKAHVSNNAAASTVSACILVLGSTVLTISLEIPHIVMRGLGVLNDANMDNLMDVGDPEGEGLYRRFMMYYRNSSYLITPNMASLVFLVHLIFGRRYREKAAEVLRLDRIVKHLKKLKPVREGCPKNAIVPLNVVGK